MNRIAPLMPWTTLRAVVLSCAAAVSVSWPVVAHAAPAAQASAAAEDEDDAEFLTEYVAEAAQLRRTAKPGDIFLYSSVTCGICSWARGWMEAHKIPFDECFIEEDVACLQNFRAVQKARKVRGTPLTIVRGGMMEGYSPEGVIRLLNRRKG